MSSARVVFDIETDGLDASKVWCVGHKRIGSSEPAQVDEAGFTFKEGVTYYAHNGIGFDYPVMQRLNNVPSYPRDKRMDTLVLSRLACPSRAGGHSLDNWGSILGFPKGDHTDWSTYSPEMREYCKRDVGLLEKVVLALDEELKGFSEKSIELEHQVAWIIQEQMDNGWLLDQEAVFMLLAELKEKKMELEDEVHKVFGPIAKPVRRIVPKIKKDGCMSSVGLKYYGERWSDEICGEHTRLEWQEFNIGSRQQIAERLMSAGWKPTKFTPKTPKGGGGNPIVDDVVLADVKGIPEATLMADYLTVVRRIAMAQSWLDAVDGDDGRVHGEVNSNGAVTGRMTHYSPNLGQVTSGSKIYGPEMRSCWTVPQGHKLVGMDADGLELRMLAHYMNDPEYTRMVAEGDKDAGTDAHTANQRAAGLNSRDDAKTFIYAFLYGAGDAKIGTIVGKGAKAGRELKARFLDNTPALASLRERVSNSARRGWLQGLDGRRIAVRSQHAALNTLLQGAGAVVMKQALVNLYRMARAQELDFKLVGNIHDEIQAEVREEHAETFGKLAAYAMSKAGTDFNLRIPLAGTYKIGTTWKDTH